MVPFTTSLHRTFFDFHLHPHLLNISTFIPFCYITFHMYWCSLSFSLLTLIDPFITLLHLIYTLINLTYTVQHSAFTSSHLCVLMQNLVLEVCITNTHTHTHTFFSTEINYLPSLTTFSRNSKLIPPDLQPQLIPLSTTLSKLFQNLSLSSSSPLLGAMHHLYTFEPLKTCI